MEVQLKLRCEGATVPNIGLRIVDFSAFNAWVGTQSVGANLNLYSGLVFVGASTTSSPVTRVTWDTGLTPLGYTKYYDITISAAQIDTAGSANGYGVRLMAYDVSDPLKNLSTNVRVYVEEFKYRFV